VGDVRIEMRSLVWVKNIVWELIRCAGHKKDRVNKAAIDAL
jgi:hypothetical protein